MRYGLLVLAVVLAVGLGLHQGWFAQAYEGMTHAALGDDARLAVELRCRGDGRAARECRSVLRRLYLSGSLDPDRTLRGYCESIKTGRWGGSRPPPPEMCVRRYGGWTPG